MRHPVVNGAMNVIRWRLFEIPCRGGRRVDAGEGTSLLSEWVLVNDGRAGVVAVCGAREQCASWWSIRVRPPPEVGFRREAKSGRLQVAGPDARRPDRR